MKFQEIIVKNRELEDCNNGSKYKITILSNIMVHQSKEICEYFLRMESINASVSLGGYDNIVQDSKKNQNQNENVVLIFWEACNFVNGLHYKIDSLSQLEFQNIEEKIKAEIDLVLFNLKDIPLILINRFSLLIFNHFSLAKNRADQMIKNLNAYLEEVSSKNMKLIDIDNVISRLSIKSSVDLRYYYSSKTLYSISFYKKYFEYIKPIFLAETGKIKKALIFDCDNTLWKGVLGEDGFSNIRMYQEVQYLALKLAQKGVIIGLCSKNNPQDVNNVLTNHPDMILKDDDIIIKKINWNDKVSNLRSIAKDLNINIDSMVFIDDSSFEIELVKKELPEVISFQVPSKEYDYGLMVREVSNLFYNSSETKEDIQKTKIYKEQFKRSIDKERSGNIESYLESLGMILTVYIDDLSHSSRIVQMTQKTNQFNLTTKRYAKNEIEGFIKDKNKIVISISVSDKYGDNGITGLSILNIDNYEIDTLLLSCRVLGRNIEYKFIDVIVDIAKNKGITRLNSKYIKTTKNQQVADFYERCEFIKTGEVNGNSQYNLHFSNYKRKDIKYIKVKNGK
jgi:FkbH-like protein